MLFTLGHGQKIIASDTARTPSLLAREGAGAADDAVPLKAVAPDASLTAESGDLLLEGAAPPPPSGGPFGYFFENAPQAPATPDALAKLDALGTAIIEQQGGSAPANSSIPPIFTYLGQFIDHDITAQTDREAGDSIIEPPAGQTLDPLARSTVKANLFNLRSGSLGLDSLYGGGPVALDAFSAKLQALMRSPVHRGMMRLDVPTAIPGQRPPLPKDPACDLLRLGTLIREGRITKNEILNLPEPLRSAFVQNGEIVKQKAIVGDARNDENLIVAQLQVAFLRFHNRVVVWLQGQRNAPKTGKAVFERARELVRWHYQWLVVNVFLTRMCDPAVVDDVVYQEAPLYRGFLEKSGFGGAQGDALPLPLEFSAAAFRFGHSMVRGAYDHNRFFGRGAGVAPVATFDQLFQFTGNGADPLGGFDTLPSNWIIEWDRFAFDPQQGLENRSARPIDTFLARPLDDMRNQPDGVFKHLAKRNLRRGHRLNIPSGQACVTAVNKLCGTSIKPLTEDQLTAGQTGAAVKDGGFDKATPLWFYLLKEAEVFGGQHLGPLGSRLVAETLVGLVVNDAKSYWHQYGAKGRWHPRDGAQPDGVVVNSMPALLKAALLIE
jgi:hypothetical protein